MGRGKGGTWNCWFVHNLVLLPLLSYRNSALEPGFSAAEGVCILEAVLEAPLPLLLSGGLLGNGHGLSRALAGLAGWWEVLPDSLIEMSTEFCALSSWRSFGSGLAELKPTIVVQ